MQNPNCRYEVLNVSAMEMNADSVLINPLNFTFNDPICLEGLETMYYINYFRILVACSVKRTAYLEDISCRNNVYVRLRIDQLSESNKMENLFNSSRIPVLSERKKNYYLF